MIDELMSHSSVPDGACCARLATSTLKIHVSPTLRQVSCRRRWRLSTCWYLCMRNASPGSSCRPTPGSSRQVLVHGRPSCLLQWPRHPLAISLSTRLQCGPATVQPRCAYSICPQRRSKSQCHRLLPQEYRCLQGLATSTTTMVKHPYHPLPGYFQIAGLLSNHTRTCPD